MDRRDFLHPRHLVHTAGQILAAADELVPEAQAPAEDLALLRAARRAMATRFEILLPYGTPDALTLAEAAFDEIDRLEQQLTVYRETSELSRLNRLAPLMPVPVEQGLFDLLSLAALVTRETEGAYDITAGALMQSKKYDEAITYLSNYVASHPNSSEAWRAYALLGEAYAEKGDHPNAYASFEKAMSAAHNVTERTEVQDSINRLMSEMK